MYAAGTVTDAEEKAASSVPSHGEVATITSSSTSSSLIDRETTEQQQLNVMPVGSSSVDPLAMMLAANTSQGSTTSTTTGLATLAASSSVATNSSSSASGGSGSGVTGSSTGPIARGTVNSLESLFDSRSFLHIVHILSDTDDEVRMMELAIALSLQDHEGGSSNNLQTLRQELLQSLSNLQGLENLQSLSGSELQSLQALAAQGLVQVQNTNQVNTRLVSIVLYIRATSFPSELRNEKEVGKRDRNGWYARFF